jgi:hypothetical protein
MGRRSSKFHRLETTPISEFGEFHLGGQGQNGPTKLDGRYTAVDVREGGTWKIRLFTAVPIAPPAQPAR